VQTNIVGQCYYRYFAGKKFEFLECQEPGCNQQTGRCNCMYTYIPANLNYENSKAVLLDEHNHPVNLEVMQHRSTICTSEDCCPNCGHDVALHIYSNAAKPD
jgi:hypothetical protein